MKKEFIEKLKKSNISADLLKDILDIVRQKRTKKEQDAIAVVGIGCHISSSIQSAEQLWEALAGGASGITDYPKNRGWNIDQFYSDDIDSPGKMYTRTGSFIEDIDQFDPTFFGISPIEAKHIDPQHRLLLQVAYEAIENGGLSLNDLKKVKTGVFLGIGSDDYAHMNIDNNKLETINFYSGIGNSRAVAAGRISYILGLDGPTLAVDTACSSSMSAVHLAIQSIQLGESKYAIAGGVHLVLSPHNLVQRCKLGTLSKKGECMAFDEDADGFSVGEGCGIVILKLLSEAIKDKNLIHGVIRASASNHNGGGGNGLTAPNGKAQVNVIQNCLDNSGIDAASVAYIETHGAGTSLGDTIEYDSIVKAYCQERNSQVPLFIGSIKSNFGHTEAAAGIFALIKALLVVKHRKLPPQRNFKTPNSQIEWGKYPIEIPLQLKEWPIDGVARSGVNSFGIGGSNIHMIVEEHISQLQDNFQKDNHSDVVGLILSAHHPDALQGQINRFIEFLEKEDIPSLKDICYTQAIRAKHYKHRLSVVGKDKEKIIKGLSGLKTGKKRVGSYTSEQVDNKLMECALIFSGHGSQYAGMGKWMYENHNIFRSMMDRCEDLFKKMNGGSLLKRMFGTNDSDLVIASIAHPAIFSFEISLATQLIHWGVKPSVVIGHSVGEYAAAYIAGILNLEDTFKLLYKRSLLIDQLQDEEGKMMAILTDLSNVKNVIIKTKAEVDIAAINGERAIVVSGSSKELEKMQIYFDSLDIGTSYLSVSNAAHSVAMEKVMDEMKLEAEKFTYHTPKIDMMSNLTGQLVAKGSINASYWSNHLRNTVQFHDCINFQVEKGMKLFFEIGPKSTLSPLIQDSFETVETINFSQPKFEEMGMFNCLSALFAFGFDIDWNSVYSYKECMRAELPSYAFKYEHYWSSNSIDLFKQHTSDRENILDKESLSQEVYEIFSKILSKPVAELCPTDEIIDPLDVVCFKKEIYNQFNIEISLEQIKLNYRSIAQLVNHLRGIEFKEDVFCENAKFSNGSIFNNKDEFDNANSQVETQFIPRLIQTIQ